MPPRKIDGFAIVRFEAVNANGLEAILLEVKGDRLIQLTGPCGAGKSNVIETIEECFTGGVKLKIGQDEGFAEVEISNGSEQFRIRRILKKGATPTLEMKTGEEFDFKVNRPSDYIKKLLGPDRVANPTDLINITGGGIGRKAVFLNALNIDVTDQEKRINEKKASRKALHITIGDKKKAISLLPEFDETVPEKVVPLKDVLKEIKDANTHNEGLEKIEREILDSNDKIEILEKEEKTIDDNIAQARQNILDIENTIKRLEQGIKNINSSVLKEKKQIEEKEASLAKLKFIKMDELNEKYDNLDKINDTIRENINLTEQQAELASDQTDYTKMGNDIKEIEAEKSGLIGNKITVKGLTIGDDDVYFNGVPYSILSSGEKLYIGCAISSSQLDKTKVKVVFVDNVSLLDIPLLNKLRKLLGKFQVWEVHNAFVGEKLNVITIKSGKVAKTKSA
jgi:hypothetical protein